MLWLMMEYFPANSVPIPLSGVGCEGCRIVTTIIFFPFPSLPSPPLPQARLQTDGVESKRVYRGTLHCIKHMAVHEGVSVGAGVLFAVDDGSKERYKESTPHCWPPIGLSTLDHQSPPPPPSPMVNTNNFLMRVLKWQISTNSAGLDTSTLPKSCMAVCVQESLGLGWSPDYYFYTIHHKPVGHL